LTQSGAGHEGPPAALTGCQDYEADLRSLPLVHTDILLANEGVDKVRMPNDTREGLTACQWMLGSAAGTHRDH
jgi:hypothetical protein